MTTAATGKSRTSVTLDSRLLRTARALGLNVSAISEAALAEAIRRAEAEAWARENAAAIAERRVWIETNGPPLADLQVLKLG